MKIQNRLVASFFTICLACAHQSVPPKPSYANPKASWQGTQPESQVSTINPAKLGQTPQVLTKTSTNQAFPICNDSLPRNIRLKTAPAFTITALQEKQNEIGPFRMGMKAQEAIATAVAQTPGSCGCYQSASDPLDLMLTCKTKIQGVEGAFVLNAFFSKTQTNQIKYLSLLSIYPDVQSPVETWKTAAQVFFHFAFNAIAFDQRGEGSIQMILIEKEQPVPIREYHVFSESERKQMVQKDVEARIQKMTTIPNLSDLLSPQGDHTVNKPFKLLSVSSSLQSELVFGSSFELHLSEPK